MPFKIDTTNTTEGTVIPPHKSNISFNDTDTIVNYDKKEKPKIIPEPKEVKAPKTIERLESISMERNEQRKREEEEEEEEDDDRLTIFNETPSLRLDALDVQVLDDSLSLKTSPVLTGVETL